MKRLFVLTAVIISSQLHAQTDSVRSLDEVVMTANKYYSKTLTTGKVLTIITRQQLEKSGGKSLAQILNEQPGVYINGANSNPGKDKTVFLRGARAEHTLITIDGIPIYDPSGVGNHFDIRNIPVDNIERIEILKGSQSTLYGSDAIAGVVNIITRRQTSETFRANALASYSSFNTIRAQAGIKGKTGVVDYNADFSHNRSDGINEALTEDPGADADGYEQNSLQAGFGVTAGKVLLKPYVRFSRINGDLDQGAFTDELDYTYTQKSYQAGVKTEISIRNSQLNIIYNFNSINRIYIDDSVKSRNGFDIYSRGAYKGNEHFLDAYIVTPIGKTTKLTFGADARRSESDQEFFSLGFFGPFSTKNSSDSLAHRQLGIYSAVSRHAVTGFGFEVGHRLNLHSEYGGKYVFNVNPYFLPNERIKLFANISSGYRTPSLYQLFSEYGNRGLDPESSFSGETGIQYTVDNKWSGRLTGFARNVQDVIFFYFDPVTFRSQYINQDKQKDHGIEAEISFNMIRNTAIRVWYSYVDGNITTVENGKDTTYFNLIRRPKHSLSLFTGTHLLPKLYMSGNMFISGKRTDNYFDAQTFQTVSVELNSYVLLDLYAEYEVYKKLKVFAEVRNLIDQKFQEVAGFNTMGRNYGMGLRASF